MNSHSTHNFTDRNIRFNVSDAIVMERKRPGINVTAPVAALDIEAVAITGNEGLARFTATDASNNDNISIANASAVNGEFAGLITGFSSDTNEPALTLRAYTWDDTGTEPVFVFTARDANAVTNRPLFSWRNNDVTQMLMDANGDLGIGTATPSGRLDVNGTVFGQLSGGGTGSPMLYNSTTGEILEDNSTINMKEDVQDLEVLKEQVFSLRPVSFKWKEACGGQEDIGLIAEEVEVALPDLAVYGFKRTFIDNNGHLLRDSSGVAVVDSTQLEVRGVNYSKLALYLLSIVKEQDSLLASLSQSMTDLQNVVRNCCEANPMYRQGEEEELNGFGQKSISEYVLLRNDPNPFADYTDIKYESPSCGECEIVISDINGRIVKRIFVAGETGTVRIYSSEIGRGLFVYSLLSNGSVVRSSKMISSRKQ